jgi:hypothetical protein
MLNVGRSITHTHTHTNTHTHTHTVLRHASICREFWSDQGTNLRRKLASVFQ